MAKTTLEDQVRLGAAVEQIPLYVSPAVAEALATAVAYLRTHPRQCEALALFLVRYQEYRQGPLTDLLKTVVGQTGPES